MKHNAETGAARVRSEILRAQDVIAQMAQDTELQHAVNAAAEACVKAVRAGGKVLFCGNGGSAADAQHLAGEFVSRFYYDRAPLGSRTRCVTPDLYSIPLFTVYTGTDVAVGRPSLEIGNAAACTVPLEAVMREARDLLAPRSVTAALA